MRFSALKLNGPNQFVSAGRSWQTAFLGFSKNSQTIESKSTKVANQTTLARICINDRQFPMIQVEASETPANLLVFNLNF